MAAPALVVPGGLSAVAAFPPGQHSVEFKGHLTRATILKQGITLDQMGRLLQMQPVEINYFRNAPGKQKGGHCSPLAAYDRDSDRFMILDVARYTYSPLWVKADELFASMNAKDSDDQDKSRGYVMIAPKAKP